MKAAAWQSTEMLGGSQQAEAEHLIQPKVMQLCHHINDADVYPFDLTGLAEVQAWFFNQESLGVWQQFFRATDDRIYWSRAMAWLSDHFPADPKPEWVDVAADVGKWCNDNLEKKGLRKSLSHIGGHLADYANAELMQRAGRHIHNFEVVYQKTDLQRAL